MTDNEDDQNLPEKNVGPLRRFLQRTTTIGAVLPPYLLIGILFIIQRENEQVNDRDDAQAAAVVDFRDCVGTARARISNKDNFYDLYAVVRALGPEAATFANGLQAKFDVRFEKNRVKKPEDCLELVEFKGKFELKDIPPER